MILLQYHHVLHAITVYECLAALTGPKRGFRVKVTFFIWNNAPSECPDKTKFEAKA